MNIKQINVDCYGCKGNLYDDKKLVEVMRKAAIETGAKVIGRGVQSYPVHGVTAVIFLAESHILISTYPEIEYAVVEVFMCDDVVQPEKCVGIITDYLKPEKTVNNQIIHSVGKNPE